MLIVEECELYELVELILVVVDEQCVRTVVAVRWED